MNAKLAIGLLMCITLQSTVYTLQ